MTEQQLLAAVVNELQLNTEAKAIGEKLDIPYTKVLRLKARYEEAVRNNTVIELLNPEGLLLEAATNQLKHDLPALQDFVTEAAAGISGKVSLLQQLDDDLVKTATIANTQLKTMISRSETASELSTLIDSLAVLRNSFFNKNTTQVNIQNNMAGATTGYNWSSDVPGGFSAD